MNNFSNGACLARGKETCATSSLGFRDERLLILEQILEHYNELDFKKTRDISISGQFVKELVEEINRKLIRLLESKRRPTFSHALVTKFKTMANPNHWLESKLFQVLPRKECKQLRERIEEMVDLLKALWLKITNVDDDFADRLFERMKKRCRKCRVTDYDIWKLKHPEKTMAQLTHYQAQLTAEMLISGILKYDDRPNGEEMDGVDLPRLMKKLNIDTLPEKFDEECAKLRRYSHWEGEMFIIDYHLLRKYIYRVFKLLTIDQRIAMFNYDVQMKQIHKDMRDILKKQQTQETNNHEKWGNLSENRQSKLDELIGILQNGKWKAPATIDNVTLLLNTVFGRDLSSLDKGDEPLCKKMWTLVENGSGNRMEIVPANLAGFFSEENLLVGSPMEISNDLFGNGKQNNNINKGNSQRCCSAFYDVIPFLKKYIDRIIRQG